MFKKLLIKPYLILFSIVLIGTNCSDKKETCFYTSGKEITQDLRLGEFKYLNLNDNIDYYLKKDTANWIELTCNEKTLSLIEIKITSDELKISNSATCNFFRNYETKNKAIIHYKSIEKINFTGSKKIISLDTISTKYLYVHLLKGAGSIQLMIDCDRFETSATGYGDLTILGKTNSYFVEQKEISTYNLLDLKTKDSIRIIQKSINKMKINGESCVIRGKIEKSGNIYYKGSPLNIDIEQLYKGKLISLN